MTEAPPTVTPNSSATWGKSGSATRKVAPETKAGALRRTIERVTRPRSAPSAAASARASPASDGLKVDPFQLRLGVAPAGRGAGRRGGRDPRDLVLGESDVERAQILL